MSGSARREAFLVVLAALLAGSVAFAPVQASTMESICTLPDDERPEVPAEPVELCATTTLSGGEAGVIRIRVPEAVRVTMSFGDTGGHSIPASAVDTAKFAGLALVPHVPDRSPGVPVYFAGRFSAGFGGGNERIPFFFAVDGNDLIVPPGDYLLYLLPDGEPLTVVLRPKAEGLDPEGHVEIQPRRPVAYEVRSLTPRVAVDAAKQVYSAGDTRQISSSHGILFQRFSFDSANHISNAHGQCVIEGDPEEEQPAELAYAPGCPNGFVMQPNASASPAPTGTWRQRMFQATLPPDPGEWGLQSWWASAASSVPAYGALGIWLSWDD